MLIPMQRADRALHRYIKMHHTTILRLRSALLIAALSAFPMAAGEPGDVFRAIRNGDLGYLKTHLDKDNLSRRDGRGVTPLMYAAAFGNLQTLELILAAGADVNAHNDFDATALLWAARDAEKARLLIEHGANVNTISKQGRTPLMLACLQKDSLPTVRLLLANGADVNVTGTRRKDTALTLAASVGNVEAMRLLLSKGAVRTGHDATGATPHFFAASGANSVAVQLLMAKDASVNEATTAVGGPMQRNGAINRIKVTPLHQAAAFGPPESVRRLIEAGANVNAQDSRGMTPLFNALATQDPSLEIIQSLLKAGADVNARDIYGETPLDWAAKFAFPSVLSTLRAAGATSGTAYQPPQAPGGQRPAIGVAVSRSVALLEKTSAEYFKQSGCVGCHHQSLIARAQAAAKVAGLPINESAAKEQLVQMRTQWVPLQEEFLQALNPGGGNSRLVENLLGLAAAGYPADTITDSAVVDLAESQEPDGSWKAAEFQPRPPITQSTISITARAIRVVDLYGIPARKDEFRMRIARARSWLEKSKPVSSEDFAMRLSGLAWSHAAEADIRAAADALLALQRKDGGWGGNQYLGSDAFATGVAMVSLTESRAVSPRDDRYKKAVSYLLSTQYPDGSWYVRSRAIKFQPYFESGFPFGHDQWISTAATAWATQALALAMQRPVEMTR